MPPSLALFMFMYVFSFFFILSMNDWFVIWIGLEINMMSFILLIYHRDSLNCVEACMKYFFIQSVGSGLLIMSWYLSKFLYMGGMVMMYKMGAGIFYFWFPSVCSGLGWSSCFFLMTFQKIIPLIMMALFISWLMWLMVVFSLIVGVLGSLNQKEMKRLMAYSSVHHSGWLLVCILVESGMWFFYLFIYMMIIFPILYKMDDLGIGNMLEIKKWKDKFSFMIMMLSMAGMPPFLGFFLKWMVFYYIMDSGLVMLLFMVLLSVSMFYVYLRVMYDLLLDGQLFFSWEVNKVMIDYMLMVDLLTILGMIIGGFFVLFFI